ncbi:MAG: division/cell wall cluster transcriptional repressor MraZ [Terracidiphilus sp.]|jgi:MraZ protein
MFRGNHPAKVDEKGRLKLPAAFKQLVDASNVTQFYITSVDGKSAEIWPLPEWEKREQQLMDFSTLDDAVQKYLDLTSYYGHQVEIDNQARVLLPQILRDSAKLDAEVTVFGKLLYLEVKNREMFEKNLPAMEMTAEDRKAMATILSRKS